MSDPEAPQSRRAAREAASAAPRPSAGPTLDDLFAEPARGDSRREPKRKRSVGGWIVLGIVLALIGGVVGAGFWAWNTYEDKIREVMGWEEPKDYEPGLAHGEALVTISEGDVPSAISKTLYEAGVTKTESAFYDMLIKTSQSPTFYPGVYKLQQQMTAADALAALEDSANKLENTVVVTEGMSYTDALQSIADATGLPHDDLVKEAKDFTQFGVPSDAPSIEGFLFPATYTFDPDITAHDAIQRLVDEMFDRLDALGVEEDDRLRILTLASVIQKEAGPDVDDMPKIARVFLNRIDDGMLLQSDATVAYGAGLEGTVWTTEEQRADEDNIYNTYVHEGLPPGPISLPGEDAISAAMNPAKGSWLYFVAVNLKTGKTVFSTTYDEHLAAVEKLQKWCAASKENAAYCA
ncbi:MAG: endolytic transglycosylase MltG [Microbacterium sp.]|uniref:endolytic transglycosylase MltG n=1 Tax=Microbacterium sp. TaxID=51671 RepID=UPI0039E58E2D